ncbi:hypothetical protein LXA43DRAFT_359274 [Ganoderma leucocontextum]|nr:hypothetical protein LXA43DRAFT_359274 [Ganoderma leucocontextum]
MSLPFPVPIPNQNLNMDPNFRIDILDPISGAIGLKVGHVADVAAFERTYGASSETHPVLLDAQLWATFIHAKLTEQAWHIHGLDALRLDLNPPPGLPYSRAVHAFIPTGTLHITQDIFPAQTMYKDLRGVLADVVACQVVWYLKYLAGRWETLEKGIKQPGMCGQFWAAWRAAAPNFNHLDALYIVSIRKYQGANRTIVYFPEIEIRSTF